MKRPASWTRIKCCQLSLIVHHKADCLDVCIALMTRMLSVLRVERVSVLYTVVCVYVCMSVRSLRVCCCCCVCVHMWCVHV